MSRSSESTSNAIFIRLGAPLAHRILPPEEGSLENDLEDLKKVRACLPMSYLLLKVLIEGLIPFGLTFSDKNMGILARLCYDSLLKIEGISLFSTAKIGTFGFSFRFLNLC